MDRTLLQRALFLLVVGIFLLICSSLSTLFLQSQTALSVMLGCSVSYVFVQWTAMRLAYRASHEGHYNTGSHVCLANIICWFSTMLGIQLYGFVVILSALCDVAMMYYICQGTNQLLRESGHTKLPSAGDKLWKLYLVLGTASLLGSVGLVPVSVLVYNAISVGVLLVLATYAVYLHRAGKILAGAEDPQNPTRNLP